MKARTILPRAVASLAFALVSCIAAAGQETDFTIVIFPDSQNYMNERNKETWLSQCRWVADNRETQRIAAVFSTGDVAEHARPGEYAIAAEGYDLVERAGIPAFPIPGNRDYRKKTGIGFRDSSNFEAFLGSRGLEGRPWFGGSLEGSPANYYARLDLGGLRLLVLALEFFPRQAAVDWAAGVIDANPDREVIILTHAYLNANGKRTGAYDLGGPGIYGYRPSSKGLGGEELWTRLISQKPNIRAVICGHRHPGNTAYRADSGIAGNTVHQLFINYQDAPHGGDGWIGLLRFHPSSGSVDFGAYRSTGAPESGLAAKGCGSTGPLHIDWEAPARGQ
jgi:hypothetical protein